MNNNNTVRPLEWEEFMAIGEYTLDSHTKEFLRMSNTFIDARNSGTAEEPMDSILNTLTEYSHKHFPAQEELMARINFPSLDEHKAEHKKFNIECAKLLKKRLLLKRTDVPADEFDERGVYGLITDITDFITDWYHRHLLDADKRFADFYKLEYRG